MGHNSRRHFGHVVLVHQSIDVGSAAKAAAERKTAKYAALSSSHIFIPVAVETWVQSTRLVIHSWPRSANSYHPSRMTPGRHSSSSKESPSLIGGLMKLRSRARSSKSHTTTSSRSKMFLNLIFNPRDLYYQGYKKIK